MHARTSRVRVARARAAVRLEVRAPAKINLDLRVLGLRPDGFHEVRTILQTVALHDTLTLTARPGPLIVRSGSPWVPRDRDNLVWKAGAALWRALGRSGQPTGAAVRIRKRVPAGAGLGGASSDAAAALRALRLVWAPAASARLLHEVAAAVGSDVAFFLRGGTMLATGRGERTRALRALRRYDVVLASPPFGVSTPAAYQWWDEMPGSAEPAGRAPPWARPAGADRVAPPGRTGRAGEADRADRPERGYRIGRMGSAGVPPAGRRTLAGWRAHPGRLRNDLEEPVVARHPAIGEAVARLRAAGAVRAAMTGSGSTVFGLFESTAAAARARRAAGGAGWRTTLTQTVDAAAYARLAAVVRMN